MDNLFTLADARRHDACKSGYNRFKETLRKAYPDTDIETVRWSIGDVARVNLDDALWCFCMVNDNRTRVAAVMPAVRRASAHTTDERVVFCIGEIDRWLAGDDSVDLGAEGDAARAAAWAAAWAADAARAAAWAAVRDAADAARAAAWAAVRDAAWAARAAAGAAAWAAARAAARAARAAAGAAAWAAARAAARAAECDNQRADLIAMFPPTFEGAAS